MENRHRLVAWKTRGNYELDEQTKYLLGTAVETEEAVHFLLAPKLGIEHRRRHNRLLLGRVGIWDWSFHLL